MELFLQNSEVHAAKFGMAVPNERMVRALKSFSGYTPPEWESQQPLPIAEWLQKAVVDPTTLTSSKIYHEYQLLTKMAVFVPTSPT